MGGGEQRSVAQDAEGVIRRIRGVSATRVDLGADGRIEQIHVLGSADRTARVVAGGVIAALGAELGVTLEPSQVRVALLRPGQTQPGPAPLRARLKYVGLTMTTLRTSLEARVKVEHDGLMYEGAVAGPGGAAQGLGSLARPAPGRAEASLGPPARFVSRWSTPPPSG